MSAELVDDLARARAAFDSWRADRSGARASPHRAPLRVRAERSQYSGPFKMTLDARR